MLTAENLYGTVSVYSGVITELTVLVPAPRNNLTVTRHSEYVIFSCRHLKNTREVFRYGTRGSKHLLRTLSAVVVTRTELAIGIVTPCPYCAVRFQRNCKVFTRGDHRIRKIIGRLYADCKYAAVCSVDRGYFNIAALIIITLKRNYVLPECIR